jgi:hypothetical protein
MDARRSSSRRKKGCITVLRASGRILEVRSRTNTRPTSSRSYLAIAPAWQYRVLYERVPGRPCLSTGGGDLPAAGAAPGSPRGVRVFFEKGVWAGLLAEGPLWTDRAGARRRGGLRTRCGTAVCCRRRGAVADPATSFDRAACLPMGRATAGLRMRRGMAVCCRSRGGGADPATSPDTAVCLPMGRATAGLRLRSGMAVCPRSRGEVADPATNPDRAAWRRIALAAAARRNRGAGALPARHRFALPRRARESSRATACPAAGGERAPVAWRVSRRRAPRRQCPG